MKWFCVALALYLWERKNFLWLFECMLLLVECKGFVLFFREERIFSNTEVGVFSSVSPCRPYIPCTWQDDFHHRGHIGHDSIILFGGIGLSSGHLCISV
jgi:hypothetical protein